MLTNVFDFTTLVKSFQLEVAYHGSYFIKKNLKVNEML